MNTEKLVLRDEYITLGQLLKAMDIAQDGVEAKYMVKSGFAKVNGETDVRRGRKLYAGDIVTCKGITVLVCAPEEEA